MEQFVTLVFIAGLFSNHLLSEALYANGDCTGDICVLINGDEIECITDPDGGSADDSVLETYTEAGTDAEIQQWSDVAVSPIDGTIYVIYSSGTGDKLGTIDDPVHNPCNGSCQVTPISTLTNILYTGMTFDCEGNLYGISKLRDFGISQIDTVTGVDTVIDNSVEDCGTFASDLGHDCKESLFYNFDDQIFYRVSSNVNVEDVFYTRDPITGTDDGAIAIDDGGLCGTGTGGVGNTFDAVTYIGNEVSLISCSGEDQLLLLQNTPDGPTVSALPGSQITSHAFGIFNYNEDGSICKPPSCTNAQTTQPTTSTPSIATSTTSGGSDSNSDSNSGSDSDSEVESESLEPLESRSESRSAATTTSSSRSTTQRIVIRRDSDSDSGSDSGDDALVINKENDNELFDENDNKLSDNQTVDLGNKSIINLWVLFGAFTIVNIIVFWYCGKRKRDNDASFVVETENKTEVFID